MTGDFSVVDNSTGEVIDGVKKIYTQQELENIKKRKEQQAEYEMKRMQIDANYKEYGAFVWLLYNYNEVLNLGVPPEMLTKLIYVSTFMSYNNRIMISDENCMTKEQMQVLLGISDMTFWRFCDTVFKADLMYEKDDAFYMSDKIFERGIIKTFDKARTRLYVKGIRHVYHKAKVTEHKLLSYLFQAIPFVSTDFNILCFNPEETDMKKIKPMKLADYCEKIDYSIENARRLKTVLKKLRVSDEPVFSFVENADGIFIYINPCIFYAGNKWEQVKILGEFKNKNDHQ